MGKTTLAKKLAATFNYQTLLEEAEENPFLEKFYRNRQQAALATQLFFLFQRNPEDPGSAPGGYISSRCGWRTS